jgi:hypothetical protein
MTDEQFQIVVGLLSEIRDALVPPAEPVADGSCEHPASLRVSFATPRDPDHWICARASCRYEHRGVTVNT